MIPVQLQTEAEVRDQLIRKMIFVTSLYRIEEDAFFLVTIHAIYKSNVALHALGCKKKNLIKPNNLMFKISDFNKSKLCSTLTY